MFAGVVSMSVCAVLLHKWRLVWQISKTKPQAIVMRAAGNAKGREIAGREGLVTNGMLSIRVTRASPLLLPLPAPPEKCSCSYILCVFVGVNNMSTLSGYSGGCEEGVAGTCHMMAAQINCNYLVHAFRPRTPRLPASLSAFSIPSGKMSVPKILWSTQNGICRSCWIPFVSVCVSNGYVSACR